MHIHNIHNFVTAIPRMFAARSVHVSGRVRVLKERNVLITFNHKGLAAEVETKKKACS